MQLNVAFFRSPNAVVGKIGRTTSEEVVLELVKRKCLPILMYSTEACGLSIKDKRSLDFAVTRFLMKLFRRSSKLLIDECLVYFNFKLPSEFMKYAVNLSQPNFMTVETHCSNCLLISMN